MYATGIASTEGRCEAGATVVIRAADGRFLARGAYSPESQIRARVWTFDENEPVDHALFKRRVAAAVAHRRQWVRDTDAVRLIFGEADRLPGLVVDYYGSGDKGQLVCQFNSAGVEQWKEALVQALVKETGCPNVYERSDAAVRQREGLPLVTGVLAGAEPDPELSVTEHGVRYYVDVRNGHKTGFYVDQRDNRKLVGDLARRREVLNCFCYTGGFSLAALQGGATAVTSIDSSGRGAQDRREQRHAERLRRRTGDLARRRRVQDAARVPRRGPPVRPDRAGPAQVRPVGASTSTARARLQGNQPRRHATAAAGRPAVHVLVLRAPSAWNCSRRSWQARPPMPAATRASCAGSRRAPTIRCRRPSRKGNT